MAMPGGIISPWGQARRRRNDAEQPGRRVRRRLARRVPRVGNRPHFNYYSMPFADQSTRKLAKLKYVQHDSYAGPGAVAIISKQFRANGMYDPDHTGVGHQPYGFDQLMGQYFHYTVLKCTCEVESLSNETYVDLVSFIAYHNEAGVPAAAFAAGAANGLREIPMISKDLIPITIGHYAQAPRCTRLSVDVAKAFGKSKANIIGDHNFQGDVGADPLEDCYFSVNTYSPNAADESNHTLKFKTTLTYLAMFTEPRWFTTS